MGAYPKSRGNGLKIRKVRGQDSPRLPKYKKIDIGLNNIYTKNMKKPFNKLQTEIFNKLSDFILDHSGHIKVEINSDNDSATVSFPNELYDYAERLVKKFCRIHKECNDSYGDPHLSSGIVGADGWGEFEFWGLNSPQSEEYD